MKKMIKFMIAFAVLAIVSTVTILAQEAGGVIDEIVQSLDLGQYVITFAAFGAVVLAITEFIFRLITLPEGKGAIKQYVSWGIAVIVALLARWLNLGIFEGTSIGEMLAHVLTFAFGANGLYDFIAGLLKKKA